MYYVTHTLADDHAHSSYLGSMSCVLSSLRPQASGFKLQRQKGIRGLGASAYQNASGPIVAVSTIPVANLHFFKSNGTERSTTLDTLRHSGVARLLSH